MSLVLTIRQQMGAVWTRILIELHVAKLIRLPRPPVLALACAETIRL